MEPTKIAHQDLWLLTPASASNSVGFIVRPAWIRKAASRTLLETSMVLGRYTAFTQIRPVLCRLPLYPSVLQYVICI